MQNCLWSIYQKFSQTYLPPLIYNTEVAKMSNTVDIKLDKALIKEAKKALEQYPKTPSEQIERWCYIGMAAEKYP